MNMRTNLSGVVIAACIFFAPCAAAGEYYPEECRNGPPISAQRTAYVMPVAPTSTNPITVCYQGFEYSDYASIHLDGNQLTVTIFDNDISWGPNPPIVIGQRVGPLAPGDYQLTVVLTEERVISYGYPVTVASKMPFHVAAASTGFDGWVVEYYNRSLDHYFMTPLASEMAVLDSGAQKGWQRTGYSFKVSLGSTAQPVCRFYIPPGYGDSHFYSASTGECEATATAYPWLLMETGALFQAELPNMSNGQCPAGLTPVYRYWNRRVDSNHRYVTDAYVRKAMLSSGYVPEGYGTDGVVMCSPK